MKTNSHNPNGIWAGASGDAQGVLRVVPTMTVGTVCLQENPQI